MAFASASSNPHQSTVDASFADEIPVSNSPLPRELSRRFDILAKVCVEIAEIISDQLDPLDIIRLERVSRTWRDILRTKRVYSRAMLRLSGPLNSFRDVKIDPAIDEREYSRQFKSEIRKEFAWVRGRPPLHVTVGPGNSLVSGLDRLLPGRGSLFNIKFSKGRLIYDHGSLIVSLPDLSFTSLKTCSETWINKSAGIGTRYFMIYLCPYLKIYDLSTFTEKYTLRSPFSWLSNIAGNDCFFGINDGKRLLILRSDDGTKIDEMDIFDLIDDENERNRVRGARWCVRGMEIAQNTLVLRVRVCKNGISWLFFYISGLDKSIRKCITFYPSYCYKYGRGACESDMFVTSTDTFIYVSIIYIDQKDHEYGIYDTISFNLETFEHKAAEQTFALRGSPLYVGITPHLLCKYNFADNYDSKTEESPQTIEIPSFTNRKTGVKTCLGLKWGPSNRMFADENWILLFSEGSIDIFGFDELKCETLRSALEKGNAGSGYLIH